MTERTIDAAFLAAHPLPEHDGDGDKHSRGQVLVIAGSVEVPGAALLAGLGALRAGAGVLQIATCSSNAAQLGMAIPEAMVIGCAETSAGAIDPSNAKRLGKLADQADAVLIGPGLIDETPVAELQAELFRATTKPVFILDASAFTALRSESSPAERRMIVTPHAGEMAKFLQKEKTDIEADPCSAARAAAQRLGAVVAMKGARTFILTPQADQLTFEQGLIALGTSGSGDVLAGLIAGLAARGAAPVVATAWAVFLHAEAARRWVEHNGRLGLLARDIPDRIPRLLQSFGGK